MAAMAGNMKRVRALVAAGADVEEQSAKGLTPMFSAAERNHAEVVRFLVANGATGIKALSYATRKRKHDVESRRQMMS